MAIGLSKRTTDLDGSTVIARTGKAVQTGTGTEHDSYTGELGEITYDTTDDRLVAHDGSTSGGVPAAKESEITTNAAAAAAALLAADPVGAEMTFAAGLATVAAAGTAVKVVAVTAAKGDSNGFTIGTDNTLTATFAGTKLCRIKGRFLVDNETVTDALVLIVQVNGANAFETASQAVTAATAKLFEFDVLLDIANGDTIELYAENEDEIEDVDTAAAAERVDTTPAHGFLQVHSV